ncbi:penicillin amidase [Propioniferax innocua]|uniref:Penicillin amidase n=2 Tax=Propioniferax innocua TaxID=1753 RepID=A0A542ZC23_9ACTN|nr:penicillin amidase [Propioniferax innocua]
MGSIILVLAALISASTVAVRGSFPRTTGELILPALNGEVTVLRNARGIPEIRADSAEDLFTAQGFVHAQERFFEMDVRRHTTSGRLAELFGDELWETDAVIRTMGWREVAEREVDALPAETRRYLDAYAAGVNQYLEQSDGSIALEYDVLGLQGLDVDPEPWTAADSVAWLKAMAWSLDGNLKDEILHGVMENEVGPDRAAEIFPTNRPDQYAPIVAHGRQTPEGFVPAGGGDQMVEEPGAVRDRVASLKAAGRAADTLGALIADPGLGADVGSNSWVVSGERTASGKPLLANDPHLAASVPSTFLQMRLRCNEVNARCPFDVGGYSFSGMPGIIIGHNSHIGWGLTVPYIDSQDLYIEHIVDGAARRAKGSAEVREETVTLKSSSGRTKDIVVRSTSNGPLISDVGLTDELRSDRGAPGSQGPEGKASEDEDSGEYAVALRWAALEPSQSIRAIFDLNRATDFDEFRDAAELLKSPSQNLVYADVEGNIGYQLPGALPKRRVGDGSKPVEAWRPGAAWDGFLAFEDLPYAYNPPEGYIVAANQQIIDAEMPEQAGNSFGFRSQPIIEALEGRRDWDARATAELQGNTYVEWAEEFVPALVAAQPLEPWVVDGQEVLSEWDLEADPESAGMAFFALTMRQVVQRTFGDEIPSELGPGQGSDQYFAVLESMMDEPQNPWWDDVNTPQTESRDQILSESLLAARKEITAVMARDPEQWSWGRLHSLTLTHQTLGTSGIAPVESIFNIEPRPVEGGSAVVSAWGWDSRGKDFSVVNGPTMKMVVDFGDFDDSLWINQSGTSGHAFHAHYADQLPDILANEHDPWPWTRAAVDAPDADGFVDEQLKLLPPG